MAMLDVGDIIADSVVQQEAVFSAAIASVPSFGGLKA